MKVGQKAKLLSGCGMSHGTKMGLDLRSDPQTLFFPFLSGSVPPSFSPWTGFTSSFSGTQGGTQEKVVSLSQFPISQGVHLTGLESCHIR